MQIKYFIYFFNISIIFFAHIYCNYTPKNGNEENNPLIDNVIQRFREISCYSSPLGAWTKDIIKYPDYTNQSNGFVEPDFYSSKIQGVIRLPLHLKLDKYLFIYGQNLLKKTVDLFIVKIKNQDYSIWLSNLYTGWDEIKQGTPEATDCFIKHIILEKENYYQSASINLCGKYLVASLCGIKGSKTSFYDISNPLTPKKVGHSIERKNYLENCYVALTRLNCGHFLLSLWSDILGLYFYLSNGTTINDGFAKISHIKMKYFKQLKTNYQGINLIQDFENNLFLMGIQNSTHDTYKNIADLFLINIEKDLKTKDLKTTVNLIERKSLPINKTNLNTVYSVYTPNSENIWLYSCNNFLSESNAIQDNFEDHNKTINPELFIIFNQYGRINDSL